jgi:hypothetical protein
LSCFRSTYPQTKTSQHPTQYYFVGHRLLYVEWRFKTVTLQTYIRKQGSSITPGLRSVKKWKPAYYFPTLIFDSLQVIHWHYTDIRLYCVTTSCWVISIVQLAVTWNQSSHPEYGSNRFVRNVSINALPHLM